MTSKSNLQKCFEAIEDLKKGADIFSYRDDIESNYQYLLGKHATAKQVLEVMDLGFDIFEPCKETGQAMAGELKWRKETEIAMLLHCGIEKVREKFPHNSSYKEGSTMGDMTPMKLIARSNDPEVLMWYCTKINRPLERDEFLELKMNVKSQPLKASIAALEAKSEIRSVLNDVINEIGSKKLRP